MFGIIVPAMMEIDGGGFDCTSKITSKTDIRTLRSWGIADPKSKFGLRQIGNRIKRVLKYDDKTYNQYFETNNTKMKSIETQDYSSYLKRKWLKKYIGRLIEFFKNAEENVFLDKERSNEEIIEYLENYYSLL